MINKPYYNLCAKDEEIIKKHSETFPVSLSNLCREFNIKLYEADLPLMASGQITKNNERGSYDITVQKGESKARQRFTAAHELAHFLLHKDHIGNGLADNAMYRSGLSSQLETQANKLAADILMPMSEMDKRLEEEYNISKLAEYFEVSQQAIKVRLGIPR